MSKIFLILLSLGLTLCAAEKEAPNHGIVIDFAGLITKKNPKIEVKVSRDAFAVKSTQVTSALTFIREKRDSLDAHKKAWRDYSTSLHRHLPDFHREKIKKDRLEGIAEFCRELKSVIEEEIPRLDDGITEGGGSP